MCILLVEQRRVAEEVKTKRRRYICGRRSMTLDAFNTLLIAAMLISSILRSPCGNVFFRAGFSRHEDAGSSVSKATIKIK